MRIEDKGIFTLLVSSLFRSKGAERVQVVCKCRQTKIHIAGWPEGVFACVLVWLIEARDRLSGTPKKRILNVDHPKRPLLQSLWSMPNLHI